MRASPRACRCSSWAVPHRTSTCSHGPPECPIGGSIAENPLHLRIFSRNSPISQKSAQRRTFRKATNLCSEGHLAAETPLQKHLLACMPSLPTWFFCKLSVFYLQIRSEERRVGKECRSRWS